MNGCLFTLQSMEANTLEKWCITEIIRKLFAGTVTVLPTASSVTTATATTAPTTWSMKRSGQGPSSRVWTETPWLSTPK